MAHFEGALALASAAAGLVPANQAEIISRVCKETRFNSRELAAAAREAGTLAIPVVRRLTEQVAAVSPEAARAVHLGATSQDVIDTAVALCLKPATERVVSLIGRLGDAAAKLAREHAATPMLARTLLQPAIPVPFGWKAATWLAPLTRSLVGFQAAARDACMLQFGGAGGTLSSFGEEGGRIAAALAGELGLALGSISWHSARDRFARLGAEATILAGAAGKIARDVSLLMQAEVGEAAEPAGRGRGGSSAMPHKRNPARCLLALEAAQRAPGMAVTLLSHLTPEHERGLGQWQSEWLTLREVLGASANALGAMAEVLEHLEVNTAMMRANLDRTRGLAFSEAVSMRLARSLGKAAAHVLTERLCERAVREDRSLREVMNSELLGLEPAEIEDLFRPESCFGDASGMIERVLADWRSVRSRVP